MKTAHVTGLEFLETFNHNGNTFHQYRIALDDGTRGICNAKTSPPWYGEGTEVAYTIAEANGHLSKIRIGRPGFEANTSPGSGSTPRSSGSPSGSVLARWAIDAAIQYTIASGSGASIDQIEARALNLIDLHNKIKKQQDPTT
jgi:hypothetical protein